MADMDDRRWIEDTTLASRPSGGVGHADLAAALRGRIPDPNVGVESQNIDSLTLRRMTQMELRTTIAGHQRWTREPPLHRAVVAGAAGLAALALAASILPIGPARAAVPGAMCRKAGHSATAAETVYQANAASTAVDESLSWIQQEFDRATPASPTAWRLREDLQRLHEEAALLTQLRQVASIRADATPGSPAQFRAQEELDRACDAIVIGD